MTNTCDRRDCPRKETAIWIEALDGGAPLVAQDISLGGMMVTTNQVRWPGALLRVRVNLPRQDRAFRASCRVVDHVEVPHGAGLTLQFLRLAPEAQLLLHQYVDKRPLPDHDAKSVVSQVSAWVQRIVDDCKALRVLART